MASAMPKKSNSDQESTHADNSRRNLKKSNDMNRGSAAAPILASNGSSVSQAAFSLDTEKENLPVEQDYKHQKECITLASQPRMSVAKVLFNNYKLLLLILAQSLLSSDVIKLKNWASEKFSIENAQNATDIFFQLDEQTAIHAEDLSQLSDFFKSIVRYDLVHIIDGFLLGDYSLFRLIPSSKNRDPSRVRTSQLGRISRNGDLFSPASSRRSTVRSTAGAESVNPNRRRTYSQIVFSGTILYAYNRQNFITEML